MENKIRLLCVLVSMLGRDMIGVQACTHWPSHIRSPNHDEPDEQRIYYSDYVVFGTTGPVDHQSDVGGVYTVNFRVECVYKANGAVAQVPKHIKVRGAGNAENQVPGCPPSPLKMGQTAILFLQKPRDQPDRVFEIQFKPISEVAIPDEVKLDELALYCGLKLTFPTGTLVRRTEICYEPLEAPDCLPYIPKTPETTMETATTTPTPTTETTEGTTFAPTQAAPPHGLPTTTETTEGTTSAPTKATLPHGLPTLQAIPSWATEILDELKQLKSQINDMSEKLARMLWSQGNPGGF